MKSEYAEDLGIKTVTTSRNDLISSDAVLGDGWRDARKDPPNKHKMVICYHNRGGIYLGSLGNDYWVSSFSRDCPDYWRPLPDPPAFD